MVKQVLPRYAKGRSLDLGAGTAKYKPDILPHVASYVACDIEAHPNIDTLEDATHLSFADESFDTIFSFQTLEHIEKPDAMVAEIYRCLTPGGVCILTVPFLIGQHAHPFDFQRYTTRGLATLFTRHGFAVLECEPYGGIFTVLAEMLKFTFIPPRTRAYSRLRIKLVTLLMNGLIALDRTRLSQSTDFYPNSYIVATKSELASA